MKLVTGNTQIYQNIQNTNGYQTKRRREAKKFRNEDMVQVGRRNAIILSEIFKTQYSEFCQGIKQGE